MGQASRKKSSSSPAAAFAPIASHISHGLREGAMFFCIALAAYLFIALFTYRHADPSWWYSSATDDRITNRGGPAGAWFADVFLHLFGYLAYLVPLMLGYSAWLVLKKRREFDAQHFSLRLAGFVLALCTGAALATLQFPDIVTQLPESAGGLLGKLIGLHLVQLFNFIGATLFLLALFLTGVTLATGLSWLSLMDTIGCYVLDILGGIRPALADWRAKLEAWQEQKAQPEAVTAASVEPEPKKPVTRSSERIEPVISRLQPPLEPIISKPSPRIEPVIIRSPEVSVRLEKERPVALAGQTAASLPSLGLLDMAGPVKQGMSEAALEAMSRQVELKLRDFGIEVQVVAVQPGPVITRFELQPVPGLKVSQVTNLAKDLARSLSVISVRVVEVIPGKSVIGLEIPNEQRSIVRLSETLKAKDCDSTASPLTLALGKDIGGQPVLVDLARMPHLLVAGTTGSGKSVGINAMILSLLYNAIPDQVRLIMIDPKMLELSVYEGIPHLLAPVVTDMKEAANALRWCVAEMDRRYKLMATLGVRNITGYNDRIREAEKLGQPLPDPFAKVLPGAPPVFLTTLPFIVVLVDEFADMMMVVGKKVEDLIARLAQKARASGIHLILATQRPSVDVITGLIKANIPTRIAFQVSSKIDSRTILDQMGAEQLLGHGDMLYLPPGTAVPVRIHGAFVADHEVHKVVEHLKRFGAPEYVDEILQGARTEEEGGTYTGEDNSNAESDPLYDQALHIVTESRRASISGVQRRLKIGYNRAARLIEDMEKAGVVGALQPNGSREVLAPPPPKD